MNNKTQFNWLEFILATILLRFKCLHGKPLYFYVQKEKIISVSKSKSLLIIDMAMGYAIILVFKHFLNIFLV